MIKLWGQINYLMIERFTIGAFFILPSNDTLAGGAIISWNEYTED